MSDPLKTAIQTPAFTSARALCAAGAMAIGFGLFAVSAPAVAAPLKASGLEGPGAAVLDAGYRRYKRKNVIIADSYDGPNVYYVPKAAKKANQIPPYYEQSDEIRELRRAFPSTNWPPSMRY